MVNILLDLPVELRMRVLEELFSEYPNFFVNRRTHFAPAALKVNRQLRHEGQQVYYGNLTWQTYIHSYGGSEAATHSSVISTLRDLDRDNDLWRIRNVRLTYIIRSEFQFALNSLTQISKINRGEKRSEIDVLCELLSRAPALRNVEIKWNDHCPEANWSTKRQALLEPLAVLSECSAIIIIRPTDEPLVPKPGATMMQLPDAELTKCIKEITGIQPTWG